MERPQPDGRRRSGSGAGADRSCKALRGRIRGCPRADGAANRPVISCRSTESRSRRLRWDTSARDTKHIYIYSPSSAVRDKAVIRRGVARLQALGHEVELDEAVLATHMRFAGDDETRLAAIQRAAASGADVALITRGGLWPDALAAAHPLQGDRQGHRQGHAVRGPERFHRVADGRAGRDRRRHLVRSGPG